MNIVELLWLTLAEFEDEKLDIMVICCIGFGGIAKMLLWMARSRLG